MNSRTRAPALTGARTCPDEKNIFFAVGEVSVKSRSERDSGR